MAATRDLRELLAGLRPALVPGAYAFLMLPDGVALDAAAIVASVREPEGLSVVVPEDIAHRLGLPIAFQAAWITLTVHSHLAAVGLTAAVSRVLVDAGIACNVVAGVHHDHLFVPSDAAQRAVDVLGSLSLSART